MMNANININQDMAPARPSKIGIDEARYNATNPDKESFADKESFSDGNIVVGVSDTHLAVSFNNTDFNQNSLLQLNAQDAITLYSVLTPALRAKGWLV